MDRKDDPAVVENATAARQGRTGVPVLFVLAAGLILALVAWGWAEWWREATDPPTEQNTAAPQPGAPQAPPQAPTAGSGNTAPTDSTPHSQSGTGGPVPTTNSSGSTTARP
jgi:hypothetical protein